MSEWLQHLFGANSGATHLIHAMGDAKALYAAGGGLVTLTTNKFVAPTDREMVPLLKFILLLGVVAGGYFLPLTAFHGPDTIVAMTIAGTVVLLVYIAMSIYFRYKIVEERSWRIWPMGFYKSSFIMGGLQLTPEAQSFSQGKHDLIQTFLENQAYGIDAVWLRPGRVLVIVGNIILYIALVVVGNLTLILIAEDLTK
jgi:hypothetical protein